MSQDVLVVTLPPVGALLPGHAHIEDSGKVRLCAGVGDSHTVDWTALPPPSDEKDMWIAQLETKLASAWRSMAVAEAKVEELEVSLSDWKMAFDAERDFWRRHYDPNGFAGRAEAELVERKQGGDRSFPLNALKHSR